MCCKREPSEGNERIGGAKCERIVKSIPVTILQREPVINMTFVQCVVKNSLKGTS